MIISRTPFRISFFGGGTDFPGHYHEHGGAVLATTIDKYAYILLHGLGPFFKHKYRVNYARSESVCHPSEIEHPLARECLLHFPPEAGVEIAHVADLPGRTGLGSSSSFTVGLLNVLHCARGEEMDAEDLAREAIHIERDCVGDPGGHQDQYVAAYGGMLRITFGPGQTARVNKVGIPASRLHQLENRLMMFFTGVEQSANAILREQEKKIPTNQTALLAMQQMVDAAENVLCGEGPLHAFGELLHETWKIKQQLAKGISNEMVNEAYAAARQAGCVGGKLLGAGGRGFLLLFAEPEVQPAIRNKLRPLTEVNFRFGSEGSQIIFRQQE